MGLLSSSKKINGYLGVDIGTFGIKIVELEKDGSGAKLMSYGFSEYKNIESSKEEKESPLFVAKVINKIIKEAEMTSRSVIASLPTFSVFTSILNLSKVSKKELKAAVYNEAKKVLPLPIDEMNLEWREIEKNKEDKNNIKIFLTGAPRVLIKRYIEIFKNAHLNLLSLETETFSLVRSLMGKDKSAVAIVEIGANTTDISIVNKSIPIISRSIDMGGSSITNSLSKNFNMDAERAEQIKYDLGIKLSKSENNNIPEAITEVISPIVNGIKFTINNFQNKNDINIEKIILSGGSAMLSDLPVYLSKMTDKKVIIGNPWARIISPDDLKPTLEEIGSKMSVAAGLALREIT